MVGGIERWEGEGTGIVLLNKIVFNFFLNNLIVKANLHYSFLSIDCCRSNCNSKVQIKVSPEKAHVWYM